MSPVGPLSESSNPALVFRTPCTDRNGESITRRPRVKKSRRENENDPSKKYGNVGRKKKSNRKSK